MGAVGAYTASEVSKKFNVTSGSSSSSSNSSNNAHRKGEGKNIQKLSEKELKETIDYIERVQIPSTDKNTQQIRNFFGKILTGSKFLHEGLLIKTEGFYSEKLLFFLKKNKFYSHYYVCQTYPIELKKFDNYDEAIQEIKKYWPINKDSKKQNAIKVDLKGKNISIEDIKKVVENLPDEYDLFTNNCQHFCQKVLKGIGL